MSFYIPFLSPQVPEQGGEGLCRMCVCKDKRTGEAGGRVAGLGHFPGWMGCPRGAGRRALEVGHRACPELALSLR